VPDCRKLLTGYTTNGRVWRNSLELFWGLKFSLRK
jgi:hypothetical protein